MTVKVKTAIVRLFKGGKIENYILEVQPPPLRMILEPNTLKEITSKTVFLQEKKTAFTYWKQ